MLIIHDVTLTFVIFSETWSFYRLKWTQLYILSCTKLYFECPYYHMFLYGFSSCTCLYEWLYILVWVFVMHMFVRMTIHIIVYGFSSCTFLYKWLSITFEWVFEMYMFVRMTIHSLMGFRHAHFCTNYYPFYCLWVFVMNISVRMTIHLFWMGFRHVHVFTNDYHFLM